MADIPRGASRANRKSLVNGVGTHSMRRLQMLLNSAGHLYRDPLTTALLVTVVGVALALPLGFLVLLNNLEQLGAQNDGQLQASLFLSDRITDERAYGLAEQLENRIEVSSARALGRSEALAEFRKMSGFGSAMDLLDENPLPPTVVLTLSSEHDQQTLTRFIDEIGRLPEVDMAQLDEQWLERLYALSSVLNRTVFIVAIVLAISVVLVVGSTIGLDIQRRNDEISVIKLVGGPDDFIRRPFLYAGFWYGVFGGALACILVLISILSLSGPVGLLADLYGSQFSVSGLSLTLAISTLFAGATLGMLGSWTAVSRLLQKIEPR